LALEEELDEQLGGGEKQVEKQRAAGEGGVVEDEAEEPEEEVDEEGEVEGLVEASGVGGREGFGGFLEVVLVGIRGEVSCILERWT
jgi:hypothetical protein